MAVHHIDGHGLAGIILCATQWPSGGERWLDSAYVPALTWLFSGIFGGIFTFAVAAAISHLKAIREYADAAETILLRLEATLKGSAKQP